MYTLICKIYTLICKICTFSLLNPLKPDRLVSLLVALTVFYHVDSLGDVTVRLGSFIDCFSVCSYIGWQLPSSRKIVHKNICIEREREREGIGGITCAGVKGKYVQMFCKIKLKY